MAGPGEAVVVCGRIESRSIARGGEENKGDGKGW